MSDSHCGKRFGVNKKTKTDVPAFRAISPQIPLYDFAQHMDENLMHLLYARSAAAGCDYVECGNALGVSTVAAEQTDAFDALTFRLFQGAEDVL